MIMVTPEIKKTKEETKMTTMETMRRNKAGYEECLVMSETLAGLEQLVAKTLTLAWIKGNGWMGGLSDKVADRLYEKYIKPQGYTFEEAYDVFEKQMNFWYDRIFG